MIKSIETSTSTSTQTHADKIVPDFLWKTTHLDPSDFLKLAGVDFLLARKERDTGAGRHCVSPMDNIENAYGGTTGILMSVSCGFCVKWVGIEVEQAGATSRGTPDYQPR